MAKERGRPRELPEDMVYLRLAVTPTEHRQIRAAAGLTSGSMAQFARKAVVEAARKTLEAGGVDLDRLSELPRETEIQAEPGGKTESQKKPRPRRQRGG